MRLIPLDQYQQFTAIQILSDPGHIGGPVVVPNAVRVILKFFLTNQKQGVVVLGGSVGGSFNPTTAICDAILSGLTTGATWTALAAHIAPTVGLSQVLLQDLRAPNIPQITGTLTAHNGTSTGTALPDEVALVVSLRTGKSGPSGRGRSYIPGWATTALGTQGTAAAAAITALGNWAQTWSGVLVGQGITHSLILPARAQYTGSTGTVHPARPASTINVTSVVVRNNTWDSQRRRGLK